MGLLQKLGLMGKKDKPGKTKTNADNTANQFEHDGKKYNVHRGAHVPRATGGSEKLTAADICVDKEAQQYLVENNCSCIEEVTE